MPICLTAEQPEGTLVDEYQLTWSVAGGPADHAGEAVLNGAPTPPSARSCGTILVDSHEFHGLQLATRHQMERQLQGRRELEWLARLRERYPHDDGLAGWEGRRRREIADQAMPYGPMLALETRGRSLRQRERHPYLDLERDLGVPQLEQRLRQAGHVTVRDHLVAAGHRVRVANLSHGDGCGVDYLWRPPPECHEGRPLYIELRSTVLRACHYDWAGQIRRSWERVRDLGGRYMVALAWPDRDDDLRPWLLDAGLSLETLTRVLNQLRQRDVHVRKIRMPMSLFRAPCLTDPQMFSRHQEKQQVIARFIDRQVRPQMAKVQGGGVPA